MRIFSKKFWARAKNDAGERIESLRFSVPALRVGVLEYGAGQLQTNNPELDGKPVRLYYPPEAVSDEKFLKSLETAPVVVGGHDSTTSEQNKRIDGWASNASYDEAQKAAVISGVVKGAKEVAYIRTNLGRDGFGASAFVDIFNLKVESGVTPDGETYNAVAYELRATHVALAPNVRDPENKIKVTNAVVINSRGEFNAVANAIDYKRVVTPEVERKLKETVRAAKAQGDSVTLVLDTDMERAIDKFESSLTADEYKIYNYMKAEKEIDDKLKEIASREGVRVTNSKNKSEENEMDEKALAALVAATVKNTMDEMTKVKNEGERLDKVEYAIEEIKEALKMLTEGKAEGGNAEEKKEEEKKIEEEKPTTLENAKPSQTVVAAFASAYNVDFGAQTPSFSVLADLAGIKAETAPERIAAVNTKFGELSAKKETTTEKTTVEVF